MYIEVDELRTLQMDFSNGFMLLIQQQFVLPLLADI